jgi:aminoglycoside phosphotransferase (APT) family kinase protein
MAPGPDQGLDDEAGRGRLIGEGPPDAALAWVSRVLGGASVVAVDPLRGGSSSAMHVVTVCDSSGAVQRVVLRRYVLANVVAEEPEIALQEARALEVVDALSVPTPQLLAVDPFGDDAEVPALVISELPGRAAWLSRDTHRWMRAMAEAVTVLHALDVPADVEIRPFDRYAQQSYESPKWAADASVWERAVEVFLGTVPEHDVGFIHRDFHPGNVQWEHARLTGVVDWQSASIGPRSVDIGHCRANLIFDHPRLVDVFTNMWQEVSGSTYDPWGDVATVIGMLDNLRDRPPGLDARVAFESLLARAMSELR